LRACAHGKLALVMPDVLVPSTIATRIGPTRAMAASTAGRKPASVLQHGVVAAGQPARCRRQIGPPRARNAPRCSGVPGV
jgi:hypothetical protein